MGHLQKDMLLSLAKLIATLARKFCFRPTRHGRISMNIVEIIHLIGTGEGEKVEFKREFDDKSPDKVSRSIAAFANTHGGSLLIGISDDKMLMGTSDSDQVMKRIVGV